MDTINVSQLKMLEIDQQITDQYTLVEFLLPKLMPPVLTPTEEEDEDNSISSSRTSLQSL